MKETVIGGTPSAPSHSRAEQAGAQLLALIRQLLLESRGEASAGHGISLDSRLDGDLGLDSLARVELILRIERAFAVRLPERLLGEAATPRDLLRAVLAGTPHAEQALASLPRVRLGGTDDSVPLEAATLGEVLEWHARRQPDRAHVVLLGDDGEGPGEPLTYGDLHREAGAVASGLAHAGIGAGDAVAVMLPTSRDFFRAFMGIVLAGAVPVPIYPPLRAAEVAEHLRRQSRILDNCGARLLIAPAQAAGVAKVLRGLVPTLERVASAGDLARPGPAPRPAVKPQDTALLQYTSGSTGDPKGVVLTHGNLLANVRAMGAAVNARSADVFVSWLPLYHDMGLIGAWMGAMHFAFPLVVMPPTAFVNRPLRWLRAMHRFRGTISSAPNFAYEVCATRIDARDTEGLDLSSWRLAFNGAEPVSPDTLERFARRYGPHGLRREALTPVYGLAECAVGLAFPPPGRGPLVDRVDRLALARDGEARAADGRDVAALRFPACGMPLPGHEIRIVDRDGRELPERREGRIEFRGPSATAGYFRNPAKTRALFDDGWLDSGDLGYIARGELFVTGRVKDVIIRGGQHVHPYELEEAVGRIPGIRKGCVAVVGVPDAATGSEKVVVLAETRVAAGPAREVLRSTVRQAAVSMLGAPPDDVVLAAPHAVPKTSSGKIRRAACRELFEKGIQPTPAVWWQLIRLAWAGVLPQFRRGIRVASDVCYAAYVWALFWLLAPLTWLA
ncbi:MAG TPA: AMP-binding protein, partial [Usitatibacter sp.]|nr:AMP-binding protein [Usitatibacter sp.]